MALADSKEPNARSPIVDVADFIDAQPVVGFQIRLLALCAAVLFADGFDAQAMGYVAPALARDWTFRPDDRRAHPWPARRPHRTQAHHYRKHDRLRNLLTRHGFFQEPRRARR